MESNSRQVPSNKDIAAIKKYSDVLYSYLQINSEWDGIKEHNRYVLKKYIKFTQLAEILGMSRQTISNKYKWLIEVGLLIEKQDRVELTTLEQDMATLIPFPTLRILTNTLSENSISIFAYLYKRYYAAKKEFLFTYDQLKAFIGIGVNTRSNDYIIKDILTVLEKLELIKIKKEMIPDQFGGNRTQYYITYVSNYIKDAEGIELKF